MTNSVKIAVILIIACLFLCLSVSAKLATQQDLTQFAEQSQKFLTLPNPRETRDKKIAHSGAPEGGPEFAQRR